MLIQSNNEDELYQSYLTKVYQHTQGYHRFSSDEREALAKNNVCVTYGEILYPAVKKLIHELNCMPQDIFLDLGSGLGKCALQIFMQTDIQTVIGLEAAPELHQQALQAKEQLKQDFPMYWEDQRELMFACENFLESDWQNANIVYTCSTCFTEELLQAIGNKINREPTVKKVLSLRPISTLQLPLKKVFGIECSWDSALCFYYAN